MSENEMDNHEEKDEHRQETPEADAKAESMTLEQALERIRELEEELEGAEDLKNEAARAKADFYNYRQRVERDRERDRVLAAESACEKLLPVLDNLDRTLAATEDTESAIYKGVSMVQKQFLQALAMIGLTPVDTDQKFDPKVHEAMMIVDVDSEEDDGKIIEVLNRGYRIGDKLVRAALVKVGRK